MYFQILDEKKECIGLYHDGEIVHDKLPDEIKRTWKYSKHLKDREIFFANLLCEGKSLSEVCPESLSDSWQEVKKRLRAYMSSICEAKIDLDDICFYDTVPQQFLLEYFYYKNEITKHVFENFKKPNNYQFLVDLSKTIEDIKYRDLNINLEYLRKNAVDPRARALMKKIVNSDKNITYDMFGTKTGRLTTKPGSFPIMTLDKKFRSVLEPKNDFFLELDYNAAELRVFISLSDVAQPNIDIHSWLGKKIFKTTISREIIKKNVFAWLYNPKLEHSKLDKIFNKNKIKNKYFNGARIENVFGRQIEADEHHALNYIIQSTTSDLFLRRMNKIDALLKNKKSFISFSIHDSLIIDMTKDEKHLIEPLIMEFSNTDLGRFKTNVSIGKNFGSMKEIQWKQS